MKARKWRCPTLIVDYIRFYKYQSYNDGENIFNNITKYDNISRYENVSAEYVCEFVKDYLNISYPDMGFMESKDKMFAFDYYFHLLILMSIVIIILIIVLIFVICK